MRTNLTDVAAAPAAGARFATRWFFVVLAIALLAIGVIGSPRHEGDVDEYALMTVAIANHGTAAVTPAALAEARALLPPRAIVFDQLEAGMKTHAQIPKWGFERGRDGQVHSIHFFAYPALAALPYRLLGALGLPPAYCFVAVNLAMVFVLGLALRRLLGSAGRAAFGLALFFTCGGLLYWNWSSPEAMSAAALLAGLCFFATGAPLAGGLLAGLAAMHNPPIVFFAAFAPLFAMLLDARGFALLRQPRMWAGGALCAAMFALPFLYNLWLFGEPSLIAKYSTSRELVGWPRLASFFLDLNQGMLVGVPALAVALAVMAWRGLAPAERRRQRVLLALGLASTVALALPALSALNWNSAAQGPMRYAFWAAMPLVFVLLLRLRAQPAWNGWALALLLVLQAVAMRHAMSYNSVEFNRLAQLALRHAPSLYNPDPELFRERLANAELPLDPEAAYSYQAGGRTFKTLYNANHAGGVRQLCGAGRMLADPGTDAGYGGWRYVNGAPQCVDAPVAR